MKNKLIVLVLFVCFVFSSCYTTVNFESEPEGADVYLNGACIGHTPVSKNVSDFAFSEYRVRLEKDGYKTQDFLLNKEAKPGSIVSAFLAPGHLIWLLWCYGPEKYQYFKLKKTEEQN